VKIQQKRRERLFAKGRPTIRDYTNDDIKWLWAGARWKGAEVDQAEFMLIIDNTLVQADRHYILEDRNAEFEGGFGPVGLVLATFDEWALAPHVEWFPWATTQNKLRCTVGFFQKQRYTRGIGCIKVFTVGDVYKSWFKRLRRYLPIYYVGQIPDGRSDGVEHIFYLRGREHGSGSRSDSRSSRGDTGGQLRTGEPVSRAVEDEACHHTPAASSITEYHNGPRVEH